MTWKYLGIWAENNGNQQKIVMESENCENGN
jgi:hypothetical protein